MPMNQNTQPSEETLGSDPTIYSRSGSSSPQSSYPIENGITSSSAHPNIELLMGYEFGKTSADITHRLTKIEERLTEVEKDLIWFRRIRQSWIGKLFTRFVDKRLPI